MNNTGKTIGTADTFDSAKINGLLSTGLINNVANLERAIFSLEYLGQIFFILGRLQGMVRVRFLCLRNWLVLMRRVGRRVCLLDGGILCG